MPENQKKVEKNIEKVKNFDVFVKKY